MDIYFYIILKSYLTLGPNFHDVYYGIQTWIQKQMALFISYTTEKLVKFSGPQFLQL